MGRFSRDFEDVAGISRSSRCRRRRVDPAVCERCLEFVEDVKDALDDFLDDNDDNDNNNHCCCCKCCPRRNGYWGRNNL